MGRRKRQETSFNESKRIDLLELDIDIRLRSLWETAEGITDWNLEVAAAFMRSAYGLGYCDALMEPEPGQLTETHGYRTPDPHDTPPYVEEPDHLHN